MIIDFHTHIFPEKIAQKTIDTLAQKSNGTPFTNGTVDSLISHMDFAGVNTSVTLPVLTKPTQFESVVRFAQEINERFGTDKTLPRIISFAGMHPQCEDIDGKMRLVKELGFKGVKIHPDYQNTFIDDEGYIKILQSAKEYDLIVVTHSGVDDGYKDQPVKCPPQLVKKVIDKVKPTKFLLGHYGSHKLWKEFYSLLAGENVYIDTAFSLHEMDAETFKKILFKHGEDKVLFATDCPWQSMKHYLELIDSYNLDKQTKDKILYKNALKLLNI